MRRPSKAIPTTTSAAVKVCFDSRPLKKPTDVHVKFVPIKCASVFYQFFFEIRNILKDKIHTYEYVSRPERACMNVIPIWLKSCVGIVLLVLIHR